MQKTIRLVALFFMICPTITVAGDLIVHVDEILEQGTLYVGLVRNAAELKDEDSEKAFQGFIVPVEPGSKFQEKLEVPAGTYAVKVFLDTNGNAVLDANFFGKPTELYGFSNNPKLFRAPKFDEVSFVVEEAQEEPKSIEITLY